MIEDLKPEIPPTTLTKKYKQQSCYCQKKHKYNADAIRCQMRWGEKKNEREKEG